MKKIVIATRGSKLALWQAKHISDRLRKRYPGLETPLEVIKTQGDKILDVPLAQVGGKGLFVKEIEDALLDGRADIAVHSMKDVPAVLPDGLKLGVIPEREDHTDTLLSMDYPTLDDLPQKAKVGTSSLRRQAQLLRLRPDLNVVTLRGNLDTRLRKLLDGDFEAIVLATAGLKRLGLGAPQHDVLAPPRFYPAVGQGALGIEYREERPELEEMLGFLDHAPTRYRVTAERAFLFRLEGGCQVPIAAYSEMLEPNRLRLVGLVADLKGERHILREREGKPKDAAEIGVAVADDVLAAGGGDILRELYSAE